MNTRPLLLTAAGLAGLTSAASAAPTRPNILFIFADDHALQAISAYNYGGRNLNKTPNIDRIAKEGVIFQNNFCANSICSPSRATVLTGKHSHLNGVTQWQTFDGSQTTFPKLLQQAGYTTGIFGKWHLTSKPTGFDEWMVHPGQGDYYNPDYLTPTGKKRITGYVTDINTDLSIDFMKRHAADGKPFLLMCQYKAPHRTWLPGPKYLPKQIHSDYAEPANFFDKFADKSSQVSHHRMGIDKHMQLEYDLKIVPPGKLPYGVGRMNPDQKAAWQAAYQPIIDDFNKTKPKGETLAHWKYQRYLQDYLGCVASIDENVGRILDYLKESGLDKNTLIVYSSDQGFYLGEHGWFDKRWIYEESFRMPLLMRWPGVIAPGSSVDQLTQNIDFAPTFLQAAGLTPPKEMQGMNLLPIIGKPNAPWRDALYYHYYDGPGEHGVAKHYGIRTANYTLIHMYVTDEWELYDVKADPTEMHNLIKDPAHQQVVQDLKVRLEALKKEVGNPIHSPKEEKQFFSKKK